MGRLDGRVAIVTGAGRGLGRAHALCLAAEGAAVVVNDLGGSLQGDGTDGSPAEQVSAEIRAAGGRAVPSDHDVADWEQAAALIRLAVTNFGDLHVLVNNAGILRDRTLANLSETEWDAVIRVVLKGHAATTRHAMAYWRERARKGLGVQASAIHTTSLAGLAGNYGQASYAAAKLAIVGLSRVCALEGARIGVRSNAISPAARTRLTETMAGDAFRPPDNPEDFDRFDPGNVSPLVAWLAEADCPANSQIFHIDGNRVLVFSLPTLEHELRSEGRWTAQALDRELTQRLVVPVPAEDFLEP